MALAIMLCLLALATVFLFVAHPIWAPLAASATGLAVDRQFAITFLTLGFFFAVAQLSLAWMLWKYRRQSSAPSLRNNTQWELIWLALIAVVFFGLSLSSNKIFAASFHAPAGNPAVEIEVTGAQFAWYFRYPGKDDKFGRTSVALQDPSGGTRAALGIDPADSAGADDLVSNALVLPANAPVHLSLRSQDVIHSFFVPELRFKQDAVPGMMTSVWFTPTRIGDYETGCAELCGLGHYRMHAQVRVVSQEEFARWIAAQASSRQ